LIVIYVILKIRKRRNIKSPKEILKERTKRYDKRMKGEEVRGKLDKV